MLRDKIGLASKMLILTVVQYLQSQKLESSNCYVLDGQELSTYTIPVSDFVKI